MASLCFCRHGPLTDMRHNPLGSSGDLRLVSNFGRTFQGQHSYVSTQFDQSNTTASKLCRQLFFFWLKGYLQKPFLQTDHSEVDHRYPLIYLKTTETQIYFCLVAIHYFFRFGCGYRFGKVMRADSRKLPQIGKSSLMNFCQLDVELTEKYIFYFVTFFDEFRTLFCVPLRLPEPRQKGSRDLQKVVEILESHQGEG